MPGRPGDPVWAVFLTCVLSHVPMLPTIVLLYRRRLPFECINGLYSIVVSFMYHACEAAGNSTFFMSPGQWHRLDNVGAIGSIVVTMVHLACIESQQVSDYIKFIAMVIITILQEGHPWDVRYTVAPILLSVALPLFSHFLYPRRRRGIVGRRLVFSGVFFAVAIVFFVVGLDDSNDPFRMFHGLFHCFVAAAMFCTWAAIRPVKWDDGKQPHPVSKPAVHEKDEFSVVFNA